MDPFRGILAVDVETCSAADLKAVGAWPYSRHASTRVWCAVFIYHGEQSAGVWHWTPGRELPRQVVEFVRAGGMLLAHNCAFEKAIWSNVLVPQFDFPPFAASQWSDTQALGAALNLPLSLEGLGAALGAEAQKDPEGKALMLSLAKATENDDGTFSYPDVDETKLRRLLAYCERDVLATLAARERMPSLSTIEELTWRADQKINARGVYLDRTFAAKLRRMAEARKKELAGETFAATAGELANSTAPQALKAWLAEQGVKLPTVTKKQADGTFRKTETADAKAVAQLLEDPELGDLAREVLLNRSEAGKATSLAKLNRVESMVGGDGRLRNALHYCGTHTARWSSSGLQIHNLPKSKLSPEAVTLARALVDREDLPTLKLVEDRPLDTMSQLLRSVIAAPPGFELIGADYAAVEARVCAWLAGQQDVIDFFANFDAEKRAGRKPKDFYVFTAESIGSDQRQLGKVAALALQYGMGDLRFCATAANWGVPLPLLAARNVKRAWRDANAMIVRAWREYEDAARVAVANVGKEVSAGRVAFVASKSCLSMRLPSGRCVRYWRPHVKAVTKRVQVVDEEGRIVTKEYDTEELRFFTMAGDRSSMEVESTYGGKLVENATQAVARDLLAEALVRLEAHGGYPVVMHVHDSIASQVRTGAGDVREFEALMAALPPWAEGLPIAADGYRDARFHG